MTVLNVAKIVSTSPTGDDPPAFPKARLTARWGVCGQVGATQTLYSSFGVSSLTDTSVGQSRFTWALNLSAWAYAGVVNSQRYSLWNNGGDHYMTYTQGGMRNPNRADVAHVENAVYTDTHLVDFVAFGTLSTASPPP